MNKYILEYIWLGGNSELRSKTKVLCSNDSLCLKNISNIPAWNYDGSSTLQASGENSEMNLLPVAIYNNPLSDIENSYLVLCETRNKEGNPLETNNREKANKVFEKHLDKEPWFGLEQEYFILNKEINESIKKQITNNTLKQGQYYCAIGSKNAFLRKIVNKHLKVCIEAGLNISGINAEVAPYQWEFQIGPCTGIDGGDQLWIARYLLERIAEDEGYYIDYTPKPFLDINGSGCHTNFSTKEMREESNGIDFIFKTIENLRQNHPEDIKHYGADNDKRMSGQYETSSFEDFSFDITKPVNRGASIRISHDTIQNNKGYFEDRRPGSNIDPYIVTSRIFLASL